MGNRACFGLFLILLACAAIQAGLILPGPKFSLLVAIGAFSMLSYIHSNDRFYTGAFLVLIMVLFLMFSIWAFFNPCVKVFG